MLKKLFYVLVFPVSLLIAIPAFAQSETSVSRIYLINPDASDVKGSLDATEAAFKTRDNKPSKQINFMPSELPDRLGEPEAKQVNMGPFSMNLLGCGNATYAQFGTESGTNSSMLGNTNDRFFGCMYLSKRGIRIALVIEQKMASSGGLMGALLGGIKSGIRGSDSEYAKKSFDSMLAVIREKIPGILVEMQEFPGEVTRPDEEKIKALALNTPLLLPANPLPVGKTPEIVVAAVAGGTEITKSPSASSSEQRIQLLKNLAELKKSGVLTDQEFTAEKRKILAN